MVRALSSTLLASLLMLVPLGPPPAAEAEDVVPSGAPGEGEVITHERIEALRPFLPPELWPHRQFVLHEGMRMAIGPAFRDYGPPAVYREATREHAGQARIGPGGSLEGYAAGQPFPMEEIDCAGDPHAGVKIIWNFDYRWQGGGPRFHGRYTYWDRGEQLPLYYEGEAHFVLLAHRPEPRFRDSGHHVLGEDDRKLAYTGRVVAPFEARGIQFITYRYRSADRPSGQARNDDTWVYIPPLRRVRRISTAQRTDALSGTDFTFDDFGGFFGIIPQYDWECLGFLDVFAPVNSTVRGYPYTRDHNFGPYGLSFASDRWELRRAVKVRFVPRNADHPYSKKVFYIDTNTMEMLYSFAYDQNGELWKIIYHNKRWSGAGHEFYEPWDLVPEPRDSINVSDIVINVQTGTGNRIEFWDAHGTPLSRGAIRRLINTSRLTRGR